MSGGRAHEGGRTMRVVVFDPDLPADATAIRVLARVDLVAGPDGVWSAGPPTSASHDPSDAVPRPLTGARLRRALFAPSPADFLAFAHVGARGVVPAAMLASTSVVVALTAAERIWQSVPTPALRMAWLGGAAVGPAAPARAKGRAAFLADLLLDLLSYAGPDEIHCFSTSDPPKRWPRTGSGEERTMTTGAATGATDAQPGAPPDPVHPAAPPARFALGMALTPLAGLAAGVPLALLGGGSGIALATAARLAVSFAVAAADRRDLARAGRPAPEIAWALLPEGYLLVRARRLGRTLGWFWLSLGCEAVAYVLGAILVAVVAGQTPAPVPLPVADPDPVLPHCADRPAVGDVLATFDEIPQVKAAGLRGVTLTGQAEVAQGPGAVPRERVCDGVVEASDTEQYDVSYGFQIVQGRVIVRVALR